MSITVDIHALQTIPPSLINRDDMGAPKTARFGGVQRQRVSSQSWKRAIREDFAQRFPSERLGKRTRLVGDLICRRIQELAEESGQAWDAEAAVAGVKSLFSAAKIKLVDPKNSAADDDEQKVDEQKVQYPEIGYLYFMSSHQIDAAARAILDKNGESFSKKEATGILDSEHSIDMALFGRMVADDAAHNVDASVQVAHALGIHESEPEFDYYTAVDDVVVDRKETGAGMIGTTQMMSSTLYRFATVDVDSLAENLAASEEVVEVVAAFVDSFITSLPSGKQNSFAHNTLPELVYVTVSDQRSVSLVSAFEEPVVATAKDGRRLTGARALATEAADIQHTYGIAPHAQFVLAIGELAEPFAEFAQVVTLPQLGERIAQAIRELQSEA
ncbi:type I-E CRISPR-associated protein Cas7/Cse4/CasC [Corynebacterium lizhenjunii]|uniref:Type I-E CRISPR-associated protein Cas7/Cse4/CasC n=1 Tax=Corynebacterium lizhenjunii TaxID=2709394 RepID=A0A7T0KF51_9CORY|nr:type I-E CRISPR-associated protein Cas7/Cse4/CasC [Corynebacterium lizhenjunii]QPK78814.1 type I-E CRISPR-associated protein Cas7/Cse4/CasC [Corynebacterium lizhenjunii]